MTAVTALPRSLCRECSGQGVSTGVGNRSGQGHMSMFDFNIHSYHSPRAHRAHPLHQVPRQASGTITVRKPNGIPAHSGCDFSLWETVDRQI